MINRQARAITGMLKSTPVGPSVREAGLTPGEPLLEARQLRYTRLLSLPENHPAKKILPVSFREGDEHAQSGERPQVTDNGLTAATGARSPWDNIKLDNSSRARCRQPVASFPGRIELLPGPEALAAAQTLSPGLAIWSDGSRLENGRCGAGLAWQKPGAWKTREFPLGKGHEVFDAELLGVV